MFRPGAQTGRYQVAVVFSGLIVFASLSLAMTALVQLIENRLTRWRPRERSE